MSDDATPGNVPLSDLLGAWVPAHQRVPAAGTECVVLVRYSLDSPPFATVDKWDVQREDPTGMGGPTLETGEGWNDNFESDVIAWIAIPPHPPAEWDQRLPEEATESLRATVAQRPELLMPREQIAMLWNSLPIDMEAEAIVSFVRGVERWHGIGA